MNLFNSLCPDLVVNHNGIPSLETHVFLGSFKNSIYQVLLSRFLTGVGQMVLSKCVFIDIINTVDIEYRHKKYICFNIVYTILSLLLLTLNENV